VDRARDFDFDLALVVARHEEARLRERARRKERKKEKKAMKEAFHSE